MKRKQGQRDETKLNWNGSQVDIALHKQPQKTSDPRYDRVKSGSIELHPLTFEKYCQVKQEANAM